MFIEIKDLRKSYKMGNASYDVLKGVNCSIARGELCTFLGPSGSGKSTLLNIIGGIDKMDSGEVLIDGKPLSRLNGEQLNRYRRERLGFIFQFYNLIPNLTVKENIEIGAFLSKKPLNLDLLLEVLGLTEHKNKFPSQLSGGQQQRTSIGRAMIKNPTLLICDEPTGSLDYETSLDVLDLIQGINDKLGTAFLIATHNSEITKMAHRSFVMSDGMLIEQQKNTEIVPARELKW